MKKDETRNGDEEQKKGTYFRLGKDGGHEMVKDGKVVGTVWTMEDMMAEEARQGKKPR